MSNAFDQYRRELDSLRFSDDAIVRMTERLKGSLEDESSSPSMTANSPAKRPARTPAHRIVRIAASVAVALGLGLGVTGAYAAATQRSLIAVFSDIFGGAPAQTDVIEKIGHPIGASATSNGITVTADAIIGNSNSCTMVFSISRDDGKPLANLTPAVDSTLPLLWAASDIQIDGTQGMGSGAYFYDANPSDISIQYVYTVTNATTPDGNGLAGRTARVHLSDLTLASEQADKTETIAKGSWDLKFQLAYEDASVALDAGQDLELNGMAVTVDKLLVSPIGASITYTVDAASTEGGRPGEIPSDNFTRLPFIVTFKDGRAEDGTNADAFTSEHNGTTTVTKSFIFDAITNVDDIASVTIGGHTVSVR